MARVEAVYGSTAVLRRLRSLAHPCGTAEHGGHEWSWLLLVLLRQRTLSPLSGQAISEGLQQASRVSVLEPASGLAVSVEPLPSGRSRYWLASTATGAA